MYRTWLKKGDTVMAYMLCLAPIIACCASLAHESKSDGHLIIKPDAFQTLVNPKCSHCRDEAKRRAKELLDNERVLCWTRGYSDGGAIPLRFFLNTYRVISDTYGVFVYDPDAGYARGYEPSLDFKFHGWRNGVMIMKHKDGTLYSCLTGVAFDGPRKGQKLKPIPTLVSDWGFWLSHYPQNVAYHMFEKYVPVELPNSENRDSVGTRTSASNSNISANETVLGVCLENEFRAYHLTFGKGKLSEKSLLIPAHPEEGGRPDVFVFWHGPTKSAAAYRPKATSPDGKATRELDLRCEEGKNADAPWVDTNTGSHWDIAGRAVDGQLTGWTLEWIDSVQVKWFAWIAEHPDSTIYGLSNDTPPRKPREK
jgi:hypothetical protein